MQKQLLPEAEGYARTNLRRRIWRRFVRVMACIVVFCTTYALILPAITLERDNVCGMEEHTHSAECYTQVTSREVRRLSCTRESLMIHAHEQACRDGSGELICGFADFVVHEHDGSCFDASGALVCTLPVIREHTHTDSCFEPWHAHGEDCYIPAGEPVCGLEETEGHTHEEACGTRVLACDLTVEPHAHTEACYEQLVCSLPEDENHTHDDSCSGLVLVCELTEQPHEHSEGCYETEYVCGQEETEGHIHDESCYSEEDFLICQEEEADLDLVEDIRGELICPEEEIILHIHEDACYEITKDAAGNEIRTLICEEPEIREHIHGEGCFVTETVELDTQTLTCALTEGHVHAEACYDENGTLICTQTENHTHTDLCYGTWILVCGKEEHTHTEECREATENPADLIPQCDCGNESEIIHHSDSCTRKIYFRTLAEEKTAQELFDFWSILHEDEQAYILTYLEWNAYQYGDKLAELKALISGASTEIKAEVNGCLFTISGKLPQDALLLAQDAEYEQEAAYAFLNPNIWGEIHNYWVYDLDISVNGDVYQPESGVTVSVYSPEFQVTEEEYFCVAHLDAENGTILDSRYVEVQDNTITFEATGFSPYLFYTVDKSIDGGERVWGTNWTGIEERGFVTFWEKYIESTIAVPNAAPSMLSHVVLSEDAPSSQQIVSSGGTNANSGDGVSVSKIISGTDLENVFDITLNVTTTTSIQEVFKEPDMAVVLVMDISKTMYEDLDDKTKYEAAVLAAEAFVDQFASNNQGASTIGFVAFNTNATKICPMQQCYTNSQLVTFKDNLRKKTFEIIDNYGSDNPNRFTNMEAGLSMARDMLSTTDNAHKYIIFLSDGLPTTYLKNGTTTYEGYVPTTSSGTKNQDGIFYDLINSHYIPYGANYSDKGAARAQTVANDLKNDGITIFAVGVGVDYFSAYHPNNVTTQLNSTAYINDQLDRGGSKGAYAGQTPVSTIDNYVTARNQLVVGDITNDASGDVFKNWLRNSIASGYYYNSANTTELQNAYAQIFAELTRLNIEASASLWEVDDPIPLANGTPETVEFIGLWTKPLPGELILNGSLTGACIENGENTAKFDPSSQAISWDLKNSGFVTSGTDENQTFTYSLRYRVRLRNENNDPAFTEGTVYPTNGKTTLRYQTIVKENGKVSVSDQKTIDFPIPSVKGWLGELCFTKVDSLGKKLAGAEFTLSHDIHHCPACRGDNQSCVPIPSFTAVSGSDGSVCFTNIPSGHYYNLEETTVPDGYTPSGYSYRVQVAYNVVSVTVLNSNGEELAGSWDGKIVNNFTYELPDTGGTGTYLYTMGGALLTCAAILLYIHNLKRRKEERPSF